jgi:hypothetical protein
MNDRNHAVARCTSMESDVRRLTESLAGETGNRDHFRNLVALQDNIDNIREHRIAPPCSKQK